MRAIEKKQKQLGLIKIDVSSCPLCEYWKIKLDLGKDFPSSKVGVICPHIVDLSFLEIPLI